MRGLLTLFALLLAAYTRFHRLETQSLWNDEGNSLRLAQRSIADLIAAAGRDIHPPGYYLALKGWIALVGESEFGLRSLSALEGLLAVAVVIVLGRLLFARPAGIVAGLLVALSPFAVYYSQETRMYAQLGLLSALSMALLVRWLRVYPHPLSPSPFQEKGHWVLALALCNAAGLYTQYSYPFTMLAQGIVVIVWTLVSTARHKRIPRRTLAGYVALNLITLALFAPWLPTAWDQITTWPRTGVELPLAERLRTVLAWVFYGHTAGEVAWAALAVPGLLALAALWPSRRGAAWALLPLLWAGIVIGALFASGAYREANLKFLLPAQIAAALLIGGGAGRLWTIRPVRLFRLLAVAALIVVVAQQIAALHALYTDPAYARDDYRALAARIRADARPGDAIILDAPNQMEVFSYYYHGNAPVYPLPRGLGGDDAATRAAVEQIIASHGRVYVVFWGETERDPNRVVQATLDAAAYPVMSHWYGDVRLALYAVLGEAPEAPQVRTDARFGDHIRLLGYALSTATPRPGDVLGVTLFWQTDAPLTAQYKVSVQLLAPDGHKIAGHDAEPNNNRAPTFTWTPGDTIPDPHGLILPPDLPPGEYALMVVVYDVNQPLNRLPVAGPNQPSGDSLILERFRIGD